MGNPAAIRGDEITGTDTHIIITDSGASITVPLQFNGMIEEKCSTDVLICGEPAAVKGSIGKNNPEHVATGGKFATHPSNKAEIMSGSETVLINNNPAARSGDSAKSCDDTGGVNSRVNGSASSVLIG